MSAAGGVWVVLAEDHDTAGLRVGLLPVLQKVRSPGRLRVGQSGALQHPTNEARAPSGLSRLRAQPGSLMIPNDRTGILCLGHTQLRTGDLQANRLAAMGIVTG